MVCLSKTWETWSHLVNIKTNVNFLTIKCVLKIWMFRLPGATEILLCCIYCSCRSISIIISIFSILISLFSYIYVFVAVFCLNSINIIIESFEFIHILCAGGRLSDDNVHVAHSFTEVFQLLSSQEVSRKLERAFVIGGESVYQVVLFILGYD